MRNPEEHYRQQGWIAALRHKCLEDNPYKQGFAQHTWWSEGWHNYSKELATKWLERFPA